MRRLWLYFPTLYAGEQSHPGTDLRPRAGEGEDVGEIVIAPCSPFCFFPTPLQNMHALLDQGVCSRAALIARAVGGATDAGRLSLLSCLVRRHLCCLLGDRVEPLTQELHCWDRVRSESIVLTQELLLQLLARGGGEHTQPIERQRTIVMEKNKTELSEPNTVEYHFQRGC
jgi:hypothetical protein